MAWKIEYSQSSLKQLKKIDAKAAARIIDYLTERVAPQENPRIFGKALVGSQFGNFWRYRVGDYRIICEIMDSEIKILVLKLGDRKNIYD